MARLLYVVTHGISARQLLEGQLRWVREQGHDVAVAAAPGPDLDFAANREGVEAIPMPMTREMAPFADGRALVALIGLMRSWKPDLVNASTPKAGLLGMLAARTVGVPARLYTLRGLRLESSAGLTRQVLLAAERTAAGSAHRVIAVSQSLQRRALELGIGRGDKMRTLGSGSSNGVAVSDAPRDPEADERLRVSLGIEKGAAIVGFVGRFTRDKGIVELWAAFRRVLEAVPDARLLLVGAFESGDPVPPDVRRELEAHPAVVRTGFVPDARPYIRLMDVLAFPSHREGFPNVPLEAATFGIPTVGFRATGTVDAVVNGETGTLVELGDVEGLGQGILRYLREDELRRAHGEAARARAVSEFRPERVWKALHAEYERLLRSDPASRAAAGKVEARAGGPR